MSLLFELTIIPNIILLCIVTHYHDIINTFINSMSNEKLFLLFSVGCFVFYFGVAYLINKFDKYFNKKIQPKEAEPRMTLKGFLLISFSLINVPLTIYLFREYFNTTQNPSVIETFIKSSLFSLYYEIHFYIVHITLHKNKTLFKYIHYIHHEISAPITYFESHTHPLEIIMLHAIPLLFGIFVLRISLPQAIAIRCISIYIPLISHSGYTSRFTHDPTLHDIHHKYYKYNFGVGTSLDKLFGTYKK